MKTSDNFTLHPLEARASHAVAANTCSLIWVHCPTGAVPAVKWGEPENLARQGDASPNGGKWGEWGALAGVEVARGVVNWPTHERCRTRCLNGTRRSRETHRRRTRQPDDQERRGATFRQPWSLACPPSLTITLIELRRLQSLRVGSRNNIAGAMPRSVWRRLRACRAVKADMGGVASGPALGCRPTRANQEASAPMAARRQVKTECSGKTSTLVKKLQSRKQRLAAPSTAGRRRLPGQRKHAGKRRGSRAQCRGFLFERLPQLLSNGLPVAAIGAYKRTQRATLA